MAHETVDERDHAQHHCSQTGDSSAIVLKNEAMPHCTKRTCAFHSRGCWSHTHEQDGLWGMRVHESITLSPPAPFHRPPWVPIPDQGPYTDICCWLTQKVPVSSPAQLFIPVCALISVFTQVSPTAHLSLSYPAPLPASTQVWAPAAVSLTAAVAVVCPWPRGW